MSGALASSDANHGGDPFGPDFSSDAAFLRAPIFNDLARLLDADTRVHGTGAAKPATSSASASSRARTAARARADSHATDGADAAAALPQMTDATAEQSLSHLLAHVSVDHRALPAADSAHGEPRAPAASFMTFAPHAAAAESALAGPFAGTAAIAPTQPAPVIPLPAGSGATPAVGAANARAHPADADVATASRGGHSGVEGAAASAADQRSDTAVHASSGPGVSGAAATEMSAAVLQMAVASQGALAGRENDGIRQTHIDAMPAPSGRRDNGVALQRLLLSEEAAAPGAARHSVSVGAWAASAAPGPPPSGPPSPRAPSPPLCDTAPHSPRARAVSFVPPEPQPPLARSHYMGASASGRSSGRSSRHSNPWITNSIYASQDLQTEALLSAEELDLARGPAQCRDYKREQSTCSILSTRSLPPSQALYSVPLSQLPGIKWLGADSKFRLHKQIASGSTKHVFSGSWNGTPVALLRMRQGAGGMSVREADVLRALERPHPNIIPFYGWTRLGGADFMVMEMADHGSLDALLRRCKRSDFVFRTDAKVQMCQQIAAAMARLAAVKVLHRDLAARNVLVHRLVPVHVKICDFGLARRAEHWVSEGATKVAMRWMPPEVAQRDAVWTESADVWAFGVTMWEIFSNASEPYADIARELEVALHVRRGVRLGVPPDMCEDFVDVYGVSCDAVKEQLMRVMNDCWAADPRQRPTFEALRKRLAAVGESVKRCYAAADACAQGVPSSPFASTPLTQSILGSQVGGLCSASISSRGGLSGRHMRRNGASVPRSATDVSRSLSSFGSDAGPDTAPSGDDSSFGVTSAEVSWVAPSRMLAQSGPLHRGLRTTQDNIDNARESTQSVLMDMIAADSAIARPAPAPASRAQAMFADSESNARTEMTLNDFLGARNPAQPRGLLSGDSDIFPLGEGSEASGSTSEAPGEGGSDVDRTSRGASGRLAVADDAGARDNSFQFDRPSVPLANPAVLAPPVRAPLGASSSRSSPNGAQSRAGSFESSARVAIVPDFRGASAGAADHSTTSTTLYSDSSAASVQLVPWHQPIAHSAPLGPLPGASACLEIHNEEVSLLAPRAGFHTAPLDRCQDTARRRASDGARAAPPRPRHRSHRNSYPPRTRPLRPPLGPPSGDDLTSSDSFDSVERQLAYAVIATCPSRQGAKDVLGRWLAHIHPQGPPSRQLVRSPSVASGRSAVSLKLQRHRTGPLEASPPKKSRVSLSGPLPVLLRRAGSTTRARARDDSAKVNDARPSPLSLAPPLHWAGPSIHTSNPVLPSNSSDSASGSPVSPALVTLSKLPPPARPEAPASPPPSGAPPRPRRSAPDNQLLGSRTLQTRLEDLARERAATAADGAAPPPPAAPPRTAPFNDRAWGSGAQRRHSGPEIVPADKDLLESAGPSAEDALRSLSQSGWPSFSARPRASGHSAPAAAQPPRSASGDVDARAQPEGGSDSLYDAEQFRLALSSLPGEPGPPSCDLTSSLPLPLSGDSSAQTLLAASAAIAAPPAVPSVRPQASAFDGRQRSAAFAGLGRGSAESNALASRVASGVAPPAPPPLQAVMAQLRSALAAAGDRAAVERELRELGFVRAPAGALRAALPDRMAKFQSAPGPEGAPEAPPAGATPRNSSAPAPTATFGAARARGAHYAPLRDLDQDHAHLIPPPRAAAAAATTPAAGAPGAHVKRIISPIDQPLPILTDYLRRASSAHPAARDHEPRHHHNLPSDREVAAAAAPPGAPAPRDFIPATPSPGALSARAHSTPYTARPGAWAPPAPSAGAVRYPRPAAASTPDPFTPAPPYRRVAPTVCLSTADAQPTATPSTSASPESSAYNSASQSVATSAALAGSDVTRTLAALLPGAASDGARAPAEADAGAPRALSFDELRSRSLDRRPPLPPAPRPAEGDQQAGGRPAGASGASTQKEKLASVARRASHWLGRRFGRRSLGSGKA